MDLRALKWSFDSKKSTDWLARCRSRLKEFGFEVKHRPGRKHMAADALSRLSTYQIDGYNFDEDLLLYVNAHFHGKTRQTNHKSANAAVDSKIHSCPTG